MPKKYDPVPNVKRRELIRLIKEEKMTIAEAAFNLRIYYPTAKVITKIYRLEGRTDKKARRTRMLMFQELIETSRELGEINASDNEQGITESALKSTNSALKIYLQD